MNKFIKTIILGSILIIGVSIFTNPVKANNDFSLELISSWDIIHGGETKTAELKIINNTGSLLEGEATFSCWYEDEPFQGDLIAINPLFKLSDNRSEWVEGSIVFSDFEIPKGETLTDLETQTHPALMPGQYTFSLTLKGTAETEEPYVARITPGRGGGRGRPSTQPTSTVPTSTTSVSTNQERINLLYMKLLDLLKQLLNLLKQLLLSIRK